jgi:hypothetical protein
MPDVKNVGHADSIIRLALGVVCIGLVAYHFISEPILPIYGLIPVLILIPYFLKTGYTKVCPIMKAMNVSTAKKES